jgi:hypothetical protein
VTIALSAGVMSSLGQCEDGHLLVQFPWTWNLTHICRVLPSEWRVSGRKGQPTRLGDPRGKKSSSSRPVGTAQIGARATSRLPSCARGALGSCALPPRFGPLSVLGSPSAGVRRAGGPVGSAGGEVAGCGDQAGLVPASKDGTTIFGGTRSRKACGSPSAPSTRNLLSDSPSLFTSLASATIS